MEFLLSRRIAIIAAVLVFAALSVAMGVFIASWHKTPSAAPTTTIPAVTKLASQPKVIGYSVQKRPLEAYTFGTGKTQLLFAGGMHGGYEWNSVLLAYDFIDYFGANSSSIPANLTVTIIPAINPDGVFKVFGKEGLITLGDVPNKTSDEEMPGRFNAHGIDLNRNFGCKWQPTTVWQGKTMSAGTAAFSEPESAAIRDFVYAIKPAAVIFWHSKANAVYASQCEAGILPQTMEVMDAYAKAAGYPTQDVFNAYPIFGDSEGWLASINIPAITVELKTHETVEWERNLAGMKALLKYFGQIKN